SIDFRSENDFEWQFHRLVCGIQNKSPGPQPPAASKTAEPVNGEKYEQAFVAALHLVTAGEKAGLSKEEATEFRRKVFEDLHKRMTEDYLKEVTKKVELVTVQESRTIR